MLHARLRQVRNKYIFVFVNSEGVDSFRDPTHRSKDNIKLDPK